MTVALLLATTPAAALTGDEWRRPCLRDRLLPYAKIAEAVERYVRDNPGLVSRTSSSSPS